MQVHNNREIFVVAILRYFISWYIPQPLYTVDPNDKYASYNGAAEALSSIVHISSTCWWTSSHDSSFVCIGADEIHLSCNGFLKSLTSRVTSWVSWGLHLGSKEVERNSMPPHFSLLYVLALLYCCDLIIRSEKMDFMRMWSMSNCVTIPGY